MANSPLPHTITPKKTNGWKVFGITVILLAVFIAIIWLGKSYLFPDQFTPVTLTTAETTQLNQKLDQLNLPSIEDTQNTQSVDNSDNSILEPEAYSEANANREIAFSEREINAMIAHNTDMADKLAIDLSDSLASARLLMPLDSELPLLGGRTLNIKAGVEIAFDVGRPIVKLKGISAWGVPVPNAWMGNLKNIDLVNEFGGEGFWQSAADGIDFIKISEGKLVVKLKQ